jgi:adenylylsulfate kinase-like enzyme
VVAALMSPLAAHRQVARHIVGEAGYLDVHVNTPLSVCEQRDPKGLYARARRGELADFRGISSPYEAPLEPALAIDTQAMDIPHCCRLIVERVRRRP